MFRGRLRSDGRWNQIRSQTLYPPELRAREEELKILTYVHELPLIDALEEQSIISQQTLQTPPQLPR